MKAGIPEITREGDIQHLIKLCKLLEEKTHSFKYKSRSPNNLVKHWFFFVHICAFFPMLNLLIGYKRLQSCTLIMFLLENDNPPPKRRATPFFITAFFFLSSEKKTQVRKTNVGVANGERCRWLHPMPRGETCVRQVCVCVCD